MDSIEKDVSRQSSVKFRISKEDLIKIVDAYRSRTFDQDIEQIEKLGGVNVFEDFLNVNFLTGLTSTDFAKRKVVYGKNKRKKAKKKGFCDFLKDALSDKILIILLIMGVISLGLGIGLDEEHRSYS